MSQDDLFGAPAGWYPDPLGLPQLRWWNNHAWTEQTSAARQPMVVQDTKFAWADDELPTRREERLRERSGTDRAAAAPEQPTAETLRQLEPPRAFTQVSQGAPQAPAPAAPAAPAAPTYAAQAPTAPPAPAPAAAPAAPPAAPAYQAPAPAAPPAPAPAPAAPVAPSVDSLYTPDPVVPAAAPASPSFESIFDVRPAAGAAPAPSESLDALFGTRGERRAATRIRTTIPSADDLRDVTLGGRLPSATGPAWIIAMIPLFQLVISLLLLTSLGMNGSMFIYYAVLGIPYLIVVGLAFLDHRKLVAAGHPRPAHWGFAFLTAPVYLLLRARAVIRETGHGIGPVLVWFGLAFLHVASVLAIPGLIIALLPSVFSAQIENSVSSDALLIGSSQMTVDCPATPPVLQGETILCSGTSATGRSYDITVTLERENGWIGWQVIDWGPFKG